MWYGGLCWGCCRKFRVISRVSSRFATPDDVEFQTVSQFHQLADGVRIRVRVVPRASRTELVGFHGDELRIRLTAPPVDGAANAALVSFLADRLAVPRSTVRLLSGETSRSKVVLIAGLEVDQVRARFGL
jgi:uncharacterized protein